MVSPNADTLYSFSWLDLAKEPIVLSLPDTGDRYYLMQMLDGWTNVFASPGTRTTGNRRATTRSSARSSPASCLPGLKEIKSPTSLVWIIGRTQTNGKADYAAVRALKAQYKLIPLSAWGTDYTLRRSAGGSEGRRPRPRSKQVAKMDSTAFFGRLADLLEDNPPAEADKPMVDKLARIGIAPGRPFDPPKAAPSSRSEWNRGQSSGGQMIFAETKKPQGKVVNGWDVMGDLGRYGTELSVPGGRRLGRSRRQPARGCHLSARKGSTPTGSRSRREPLRDHFPKGQLPPVRAFWSITMYNSKQFFVANPIDRYAIGDRDKLKFNDDGSLTLYIQTRIAGKDRESNWLPAPKDSFNLFMRLYWPKKEIIDGTWKPPAVKKVAG